MIGVIGGTGAEALLDNYDVIEQKSIATRYGDNPTVTILDIEDRQVCYIPRHSKNHSIPPHMINYRAILMHSVRLVLQEYLLPIQ